MKRTHVCIQVLILFLLIGCYENNQSLDFQEQSKPSGINEAIGSFESMEPISKSSKIYESSKETDNFFVSRETIKREGFVSSVDVEYYQFYLSNTSNEEFKTSLDALNRMITDKIFYEDLIAFQSEFFEARIRSNLMVFDDKVASISIEGYLNDAGYNHEILSSINYDINNRKNIELFDVIHYDDLIKLITISDLEIYPVSMAANQDVVKELFLKQLTSTTEEGASIDGYYLTEEAIVLYTHLGHNKDINVTLKVPYKY